MDLRKTCAYFIAPFGLTLIMMAMYFSGLTILQQIISPTMDALYRQPREFGLLENAQNIVLIVTIVFLVLGFRQKKTLLERAAMAFLAFCTFVIFLEEIDYGLHFYEYLSGIHVDESRDVRNFHNQGDDRTQTIKRNVDIGMALLFVILPFALYKAKNPFIRYILPDRYAALTLIAAVLTRSLAHYLQDQGYGEGGSIAKGISEFREFVTYWLIMIYFRDLALFRNWGETTTHPEKPAQNTP
jgi:hypothetical protein